MLDRAQQLASGADPHPDARPTAARRGRGRRRVGPLRLAFLTLAALLVAGTGIAYLATVTVVIDITVAPQEPPAGTTLLAGQSARISPSTVAHDPIIAEQGKATKISGRQLYVVEVRPELSHRVTVEFMWTNPQDAAGLLNSPHAFIEAGLYYEVPVALGSCAEPNFVTTAKNGLADICVAPAGPTRILHLQHAVGPLQSTQAEQTDLYVLVSITNPAGSIPPGQQTNLDALSFFAQVRAR